MQDDKDTKILNNICKIMKEQIALKNVYDSDCQAISELINILHAHINNSKKQQKELQNFHTSLVRYKNELISHIKGVASTQNTPQSNSNNSINYLLHMQQNYHNNHSEKLNTILSNLSLNINGSDVNMAEYLLSNPKYKLSDRLRHILETKVLLTSDKVTELNEIENNLVQYSNNINNIKQQYTDYMAKLYNHTHNAKTSILSNEITYTDIERSITTQRKNLFTKIKDFQTICEKYGLTEINGISIDNISYTVDALETILAKNSQQDENIHNVNFSLSDAHEINEQLSNLLQQSVLSLNHEQLHNFDVKDLSNLQKIADNLYTKTDFLPFNTLSDDDVNNESMTAFQNSVQNFRNEVTGTYMAKTQLSEDDIITKKVNKLLSGMNTVDLSSISKYSYGDEDLTNRIKLMNDYTSIEYDSHKEMLQKHLAPLDSLHGSSEAKLNINVKFLVHAEIEKNKEFINYTNEFPTRRYIIDSSIIKAREKDKNTLFRNTTDVMQNISQLMTALRETGQQDSIEYTVLENQLQELQEVTKKLAEEKDVDVVKDVKNFVSQGAKNFIKYVNKTFQVFGIAGILSMGDFGEEVKKRLAINGDLSYQMYIANNSMRANNSNHVNDMINQLGASAYDKYYNKLGAEDYAKMYIDMTQQVGAGSNFDNNGDKSSDLAYFTKNLALPAKVYGIDNGTLIEQINAWYKDNRSTPEETINMINKAIGVAKGANIPITKYLKSLSDFSSKLRNNGFDGTAAQHIIGNLVADGLRLEDATGMAGTVLGAIHNFQLQFSKMAVWGEFTSHGTGNFWTEGVNGLFTVNMYGDVEQGNYQKIGEKIVQQIKVTSTRLGGNSVDLQNFQAINSLKSLFGDDRTLSMATHMVKNGDYEALGKLFTENADNAKQYNENKAVTKNLQDMEAELQHATELLSEGTKIRAKRSAIANNLAVKLNTDTDLKDMLQKFTTEAAKQAVEFLKTGFNNAKEILQDLTDNNDWLKALKKRAITDPLTVAGAGLVGYGVGKGVLNIGAPLAKHLASKGWRHLKSSTKLAPLIRQGGNILNQGKNLKNKATNFIKNNKIKSGGIIGATLMLGTGLMLGKDDNKKTVGVSEENKEVLKQGVTYDNLYNMFANGSGFIMIVDDKGNVVGSKDYTAGTYNHIIEQISKNGVILNNKLQNAPKDGEAQGKADTLDGNIILEQGKLRNQTLEEQYNAQTEELKMRLAGDYAQLQKLNTAYQMLSMDNETTMQDTDGVVKNFHFIQDFNIDDFGDKETNKIKMLPHIVMNDGTAALSAPSIPSSTLFEETGINDIDDDIAERLMYIPVVDKESEVMMDDFDGIPEQFSRFSNDNTNIVTDPQQLADLWENTNHQAAMQHQQDLINIANGDYSSIDNVSEEEKVKVIDSAKETTKFLSAITSNTKLAGVDLMKLLNSRTAAGEALRDIFKQNGIDFNDKIFTTDPASKKEIFNYMINTFNNGRNTLAQILVKCKIEFKKLKQAQAQKSQFVNSTAKALDKVKNIQLTENEEKTIEKKVTNDFASLEPVFNPSSGETYESFSLNKKALKEKENQKVYKNVNAGAQSWLDTGTDTLGNPINEDTQTRLKKVITYTDFLMGNDTEYEKMIEDDYKQNYNTYKEIVNENSETYGMATDINDSIRQLARDNVNKQLNQIYDEDRPEIRKFVIAQEKLKLKQQKLQEVEKNTGGNTDSGDSAIEIGNDEIIKMAIKAADKEGIPAELTATFLALINQESGFNQNVTSSAGAIGLSQLMPETAQGLGVNPHDAQENLIGGAKYFAQQLQTFNGDVKLALAAYNAGPGAVQKYGGIPPYEETQHYVSTISANAPNYENVVKNARANGIGTPLTLNSKNNIQNIDLKDISIGEHKTQNWREVYNNFTKNVQEGKVGFKLKNGSHRRALTPTIQYGKGLGLLTSSQASGMPQYLPSDNLIKTLQPKVKLREEIEKKVKRQNEELKKARKAMDEARAQQIYEKISIMNQELFKLNEAINELRQRDQQEQSHKNSNTAYMNIIGKMKDGFSHADMMNEIQQSIKGIDKINNIIMNNKITSKDSVYKLNDSFETNDESLLTGTKKSTGKNVPQEQTVEK